MANPGNPKVTKYPKNINNINIGMVFFAVMAIYIIICVITYFRRDHIVGYEVMEGALSTNNIYDAVAIRDEKIIESDTAGYINYFATEGGRVAVGNLVYTVDESGQLLDYLKSQGSEEVSLSDEDLSELRTQIVNFDSSFDPLNFHTVYDFKISLDGTVQKLSNNSVLSNIQSLNANSGTLQSINYKYAPDTGIVVYSTDGYEDLTLETMNSSYFDESAYDKHQLINNTLVKAGDPVYKLCTSEEWSVIIQEDDEKKVQELVDLEYVKVRFIKNQDESWGKVSAFTNVDGESFVQLTFTNSMITFCRDRFLNIELITEDDTGLKIPNSAIVNKNFFLVPKDYVIKNNDNTTGVLRVKYDEQGNETSEIVAVSIYNETETVFYLDTDTLRAGDTLIKTDSNDRYTVSKTDSLIGVYNINKGYADFRQISILYQNEEYSIVRSNTTYGLNVYDYIVLDSTTVDANAKSAQEGNGQIVDTNTLDVSTEGDLEQDSSASDNSTEEISSDEDLAEDNSTEEVSSDENLEEISDENAEKSDDTVTN
ncbi:HlyD family efflux transporter periplasmic adaptor subunit [Butyrivibrio sp. CB08]|uniref:HlyD family efflux transporter periplasmic adaptor subunit n=1 Tax=Butyrivibrio sp. CB08 TaxID=2364879 RepID=UPI00131421BD|nr:HlyD family efflux transporter periplasmic adaptor subunit [Butyrivibrio sp. CB08]